MFYLQLEIAGQCRLCMQWCYHSNSHTEGKDKKHALYFYIIRHQKLNKNWKLESTYLLHKFLKIWYTSFTDALCSATQQIPIILWNLMAHYKVHKKPPFTSTLSKITQVYTPLFKTYFNIIFPSIFTSLLLMICIVLPPVFHHPNIIWWTVQTSSHYA